MGTAERRERERQERNDAILDAALEVFAEKGLRNATMDDMADKAELSKGTLYLYFKSKEHLFYAIDMRAADILRERFIEAADSETYGLAKVRAIGRAYYKFCFENPSYFKAMSYVESMDAATFKAVSEEMLPPSQPREMNTALTVLIEAIRLGHRDGTIAVDMDPEMTAALLWAMSNGIVAMIKNRGEYYKLIGSPIDSLIPAKELLVQRGLAPVPKS